MESQEIKFCQDVLTYFFQMLSRFVSRSLMSRSHLDVLGKKRVTR